MSFYKEISELPFFDFTLKEFGTWRNLLEIVKLRNFADTDIEETIQIVYYQLAIRNYESASYYLNKFKPNQCKSVIHYQIRFLKVLLHFGETGSANNKGEHTTFNSFYRELFNLGCEGYKPSMMNVGNIVYLPLKEENTKPTMHEMLLKIKQNMENEKFDSYYISNVNKKIQGIEHMLNYSNFFNLLQLQQNNYNALDTIFKLTFESVLNLALEGSKRALLELLNTIGHIYSYDIPNYIHTTVCGDNDHPNTALSKMHTFKVTIKNLIAAKISEFDHHFINRILQIYKSTSSCELQHLMIEPHDLIVLCLDKVHKTIKSSDRLSNTIGVVVSYSSFVAKTKANFNTTTQYVTCRSILFELYKEGLLFLPTPKERGTLPYRSQTCDFHKLSLSPLRLSDEEYQCTIEPISELMNNYFWSEGHGDMYNDMEHRKKSYFFY